MPPELNRLFTKFNALGAMLPPRGDSTWLEDPERLLEVMTVLEAMHVLDEATEAFIGMHTPQKTNVHYLDLETRYRQQPNVAERMRKYRARKRNGAVVLRNVAVPDEVGLQHLLVDSGLLAHDSMDDKRAVAEAAAKFLYLAILEKRKGSLP